MAEKYDPRTTSKWGKPKRNTWSDNFGAGTAGNEALQEQAIAMAQAGADMLPVIGDARSLGRAYDAAKAGNWGDAAFEAGTTAAGWIPVAGPLARGSMRAARNADLAATAARTLDPDYAKLFAREVAGKKGPLAKPAGASPFYGMSEKKALDALEGAKDRIPTDRYHQLKKGIKDSRNASVFKNERKAKGQFEDLLGPDWRNIVQDMELEKAVPEISSTTKFREGVVVPKGGRNKPITYRPYQTREGDIVHGTFMGEDQGLGSIMGGTDMGFGTGGWSPTRTGTKRPTPSKNFAVMGDRTMPDNTIAKQLAKKGIKSAEDLIMGRGPLAK